MANHVTGAPAECDPGAGFAPSVPFQSVTQNADGTFTVVFTPISVPANGSTLITYTGRNRTVYTGGTLAGEPIAAGDSFTDSASEQGTSTPVAATGFTGTQTVQDATSATQTTSLGTLTTTVAARTVGMDCGTASYGTSNPVFVKGDRMCFQITVPFSTANQTRNPVVTDFLPPNTSYEPGSVSYPVGQHRRPGADHLRQRRRRVRHAQLDARRHHRRRLHRRCRSARCSSRGSARSSPRPPPVRRRTSRATSSSCEPRTPPARRSRCETTSTSDRGSAAGRDHQGRGVSTVPPWANPANTDHVGWARATR